MYMSSGLKNKMAILHATTTTKVKIDHTKRALLTHMLPPQASEENTEFLGGGEGVVPLPLPRGEPEQVAVKELLLLDPCKVNKCTKKKDKYD